MYFSTFVSAAALFKLSIAGYVLEDDYMRDFYGAFNFFTSPDPTNGFVKYVDEATARQTGLINASTTVPVEWGVDHQNQTPEGRPSIRLESKKTYNSGLVVLDVQHMPFGCGTWPAFWMVGPDWPTKGEIDILEGVNEQTNNGMTLHTGPGCAISSDAGGGAFEGSVQTSNCDVKAEGQDENAGCSIKHPSEQSYGSGLNDIGGGVYATEWTTEAINVYFFPRGSIPQDALGDNPDPSSWGKPAAQFSSVGCDIEKIFQENQIVFDTTFCGDWAGNVWESGSCASKAPTCNEYVQNNPEAFANAHWTINALKVYQNNGETPSPSAPAIPSDSTVISIPIPSGTEVPTPAPLPTGNDTFPTIAPSLPSSILGPLPTGSEIFPSVLPSDTSAIEPPLPTSGVESPPIIESSGIPQIPVESSLAPSVPVPTSIADAPTGRPQWTRSWGGGFGRPTQSINPDIAAPSGGAQEGKMGGFDWPEDGKDQPAQSSGAVAASSESTVQPISTDAPAATPTAALQADLNTQVAAPTGGAQQGGPEGEMSGFQWPQGGQGQPSGQPAASSAPPIGTGAPAANSSSAVPVPTTVQTVPVPSAPEMSAVSSPAAVTSAPVVGQAPQPTGAADVPTVTDEVDVVETVHQTVYVTVPATGETPAPGSRKARHVREHRRRMTQHNARRI